MPSDDSATPEPTRTVQPARLAGLAGRRALRDHRDDARPRAARDALDVLFDGGQRALRSGCRYQRGE
jgi:hypothetical protein